MEEKTTKAAERSTQRPTPVLLADQSPSLKPFEIILAWCEIATEWRAACRWVAGGALWWQGPYEKDGIVETPLDAFLIPSPPPPPGAITGDERLLLMGMEADKRRAEDALVVDFLGLVRRLPDDERAEEVDRLRRFRDRDHLEGAAR